MVISLSGDARQLKIGIVCPYGWDVHGGVQVHVKELAEHFIAAGHQVSVIAPVSDEFVRMLRYLRVEVILQHEHNSGRLL